MWFAAPALSACAMLHGLMWTFANALRAGWRFLPIKYRAAAKEAPDVAELDYAGSNLRLHVSSAVDLDRAGACSKEPETVRWLEEMLADGGVLYDIGANVGAYSLVAWACSHGKARVVAFEPGFSTFPQLCRNVLLNGCQDAVTPLNVALSDRNELQVFKYSSLLGGAASHLGLSVNGSASGQNSNRVLFSQPMWVQTLDDVIAKFGLPAPNHIKIDVDGHELAVLRGADKTLRSGTVRSVQIEIGEHDPDTPAILSVLEQAGFRISRVSPHKTGQIADYVFVRA